MLALEAEAPREVEVEDFRTVAGGGEDGSQRGERLRHRAGLLFQLPQAAAAWVLSRFQFPGGQFQQGAAEYIAVLGDGKDVVVLVQRQHGHAAVVFDDFPFCHVPVGKAHIVHVDGEHFPLIDFGLVQRCLLEFHGWFSSCYGVSLGGEQCPRVIPTPRRVEIRRGVRVGTVSVTPDSTRRR